MADGQCLPDDGRHGAALGVVDEAGVGEVDSAAAGFQLAATSGQHVAHPVGFWAVGEGDHVAITAAEEENGGAVDIAGFAAAVGDDRHAGDDMRQRAEDAVGDEAVEAGQAASGGHRDDLLRVKPSDQDRQMTSIVAGLSGSEIQHSKFRHLVDVEQARCIHLDVQHACDRDGVIIYSIEDDVLLDGKRAQSY